MNSLDTPGETQIWYWCAWDKFTCHWLCAIVWV